MCDDLYDLAEELGLTPDEAVREVEDFVGFGGDFEYLLSLQGENGGVEECMRFAKEWNKRYPQYQVVVRSNSHDFGIYYSVEMRESLFDAALRDKETFPQGPEEAAAKLADELGYEY